MASHDQPTKIGRRHFVSTMTAAGTAAPLAALAQNAMTATPTTATQVAQADVPTVPTNAPRTSGKAKQGASQALVGADVMVDVMQTLNLEYIAANPASSFRGLHESVLNYGSNKAPEFITCLHEESSVAIAHGYAKITGRPMAVAVHATVGLQHASMALYNAWCDQVPLVVIAGNIMDATQRRPGVEWTHTAQDPVVIVRDFIKWDDQPASLQHFGESLVRAYKIAMTPPMGPVVLVADAELQEGYLKELGDFRLPRLSPARPPQGDGNAVREAAKMLVAAEHPVIVADRLARTPQGMLLLVKLAEMLGAPVIDQGGRMNFPNTHSLSQNDRGGVLLRGADVILALELTDLWGVLNSYIDNEERTVSSNTKVGTKVISINSGDLFLRSNYQNFQRYAEADIAMAADGEATLPALIEAVSSALDDAGRRNAAARTEEMKTAKAKSREAAALAATYAWDASPISTARLAAELWGQIKGDDWSMVSTAAGWPRRLWQFDKHYHHIGGMGGYGLGYGLPAAVGAALANRAAGRLSVNIQTDGDLMYAPGALWTAVHHKIPLLSVMHNNRAYHQEIMHVQRMANRHNRGIDTAHIGTTITNPDIDYASLARSMGMWAEGPISDPAALGPALKRASAIVRSGAPALVDVITQPR